MVISNWRIREQMNVANTLSLIRLFGGISVPLWFQFDQWSTVIWFGFFSLTDLEGVYARWRGAVTHLGTELDPIADKVFANGVLLMIAIQYDQFAIWILLVVTVLYDIDNTLGRWINIRLALKNYPPVLLQKAVTKISKWKTAMLFLTLLLLINTRQFPVGPFEYGDQLVVDVFNLAAFTNWFVILSLVLVIASWWKNRHDDIGRWLNIKQYTH